MTKTKGSFVMEAEPTHQRGARKNNVWTRDKITRLIRLYRQHECIWNNYIEAYKNKDKRNQAIEEICNTLHITKFDFGKKIHNLRNQFNAELKKLERRIEQSGGESVAMLEKAHFRSRWEHYESLLFLKDVIAPRPGYQSGSNCSYQQPRKLELKFQPQASDDDEVSHVIISHVDNMDSAEHAVGVDSATTIESLEEDETEFQYEETTPEDEFEMAEQAAAVEYITPSTDSIDQKYNPPATMREVIITTLPQSAQAQNACKQQQTSFFTALHHNQRKNMSARSHLLSKSIVSPALPLAMRTHEDDSAEVPDATVVQNKQLVVSSEQTTSSSPKQRSCKRRVSELCSPLVTRDQWDVFGELVAAEFRNLNSDLSRKKLKRKIMQAMLDVGEADDGININIAIN